MVQVIEKNGAGQLGGRVNLRVRDVTGTHFAELTDVDPRLNVRAVADSIAARMSMPNDGTAWALRTESTAEYLDDVPLGEALNGNGNGSAATAPARDVELVLTPKAHLG